MVWFINAAHRWGRPASESLSSRHLKEPMPAHKSLSGVPNEKKERPLTTIHTNRKQLDRFGRLQESYQFCEGSVSSPMSAAKVFQPTRSVLSLLRRSGVYGPEHMGKSNQAAFRETSDREDTRGRSVPQEEHLQVPGILCKGYGKPYRQKRRNRHNRYGNPYRRNSGTIFDGREIHTVDGMEIPP